MTSADCMEVSRPFSSSIHKINWNHITRRIIKMKHVPFLRNSISLILAIIVLASASIVPVSARSGSSMGIQFSPQQFIAPIVVGLPWAVGETWNFTQNFHGGQNALDFQTTTGRAGRILAADSGTVVSSPTSTCILIDRGDGIKLGYQHLEPSDLAKFKQGDFVQKGAFLGMTTFLPGCDGTTDGNLVHFWAQGDANFEVGSVIGGFTVGSICGNAPSLNKDGVKYCPITPITYTEESVATCYSMTSTHTGNGGDPVASPANSASCPIGQYITGESITLTASPSSGWGVGSWTGTGNNASTSINNTITMPGSAHQASVAYVDIIAPTVVSSVRAGVSPTNAASVNYTVTFSEAVTGVDGADFVLSTTGTISGASVGTVAGSGSTYTVPVNTGSGSGDLRLDVSVGATITDSAGSSLANRPFTTGQSYAIDKTAPTVVSSVRSGVSPTNAASVNYTVTFSEAVTGVDSADFVLSTTGTLSGASVGTVAGSGSTYTVPVNTGSGSGDLRLDVSVGATVTDSAGNSLANRPFTTGESYAIDKTAPTVVSIVRAGVSPTYAASVNYTVTFSEAVTGVDSADFVLSTTGTISGASVGTVAGSGSTYTVPVNTGTGDGDLRLDVLASAGISDMVGNALTIPFTGGESYTVDRIPPTAVSIVNADPNPTSASSVNYTVTFSEAVAGVDSADFALITTGTLSGVSVAPVVGSGSTYTVTVNTGSGDGDLRLVVSASATVTDQVGRSLVGLPYISGAIYTVDRKGPTVVSVVPARANGDFVVTFSEPVQSVEANDFALVKTGDIKDESITNVVCLDNICLVGINTGRGSGTLRLDVPVSATITDRAGGALTKLPYTTGKRYTIMIEAFRSTGSGDGWLLESAAGSGLGGSANSTATSFTLGDDALNRQYRTLLHFPTAYLPDNAVVIQADLMIKKQDEYGATFDTFGNLTVDIRNGLFVSYHDGGFGSLVPANFEARADAVSVGAAPWNKNVTGWYWTTLSRDANPFISLNAGTQIRLGYQTATNMNGLAEYVRFYSGDHESQKDRPHLQIRYCVPG
jgi:hypothetical protein